MEEWSSLCRCCLSAGSTSLLQDEDVRDKFHETTSIEVKEDDGLPQKLCKDCLSIMNSAHQFRKQCVRIDTELKLQLADIGNFSQEDIVQQPRLTPEPSTILPDTIHPTELAEPQQEEDVDVPGLFPEVLIKSEAPEESDDDCYYVLVIDDENANSTGNQLTKIKNNKLCKIKEETKELNPATGELEFEKSVDSFLVKNTLTKPTKSEELEIILDNDSQEYFIEDPDTNDSEEHTQIELTGDLNIEDAGALLANHENGNIIKILTSNGTTENLLFKSQKGDEIVTYIVDNQLVSGESDGLSQEGEVIVCEGDVCEGEDSQFQILNYDGSELVIEYADDGQIASTTMMRQSPGTLMCSCGIKFTDFTLFENHQILHHSNEVMAEVGNHLCSLCGKGFESHEILTGHMLLHTTSNTNINCPYCEQLVKRNSITQHIKYSHNNIKPRCNLCGKTFANPNNLKRHMMIHTGIRLYECDICNKRFQQKITMQTHRMTHSVDPLFCKTCEIRFDSTSDLIAHQEQHECDNATEALEVKTIKGKSYFHSCSICNKIFSLESALQYHMENSHGNETPNELLCSECGEVLPNRKAMYNHSLLHQPELSMKARVGKRFECTICRKTCASNAMLVMHERVHTNERPYPCPRCALRFKTKTHLRTHQLTHTREKRFGCSVCMKFFALKGNLVVHLRTHTGERPYVCSLCDDAFIDSKYLKKHKMRKHAIGNVPWNKY